ncbi:MAG: SUF system Fe-S cluster assembly protein [Candidatus Polarisedimenticolia bacterium]
MDDAKEKDPSPAVPAAGASDAGAAGFEPRPDLREKVIEVLQSCYDPEIPVNIYELGLVYGVEVGDEGKVAVTMTLTSPACPVAGSLPIEVEAKVRALEGVTDARVEVVWDPPWTPERMSDLAKLQLNMM